MTSLYSSLLGPSWSSLAPAVRRLHAGNAARGVFAVRRGRGLAWLIGAILGMPPAAEATAITLAVDEIDGGERWVRRFGGRPLTTLQWGSGGLLVERLGLGQCWFRLRAEAGALIFEQVRATFGFRGLSLPLPRALAPRAQGRATPEGDRVRVDVSMHAPIVGLIVAYEGTVTPEAAT